MMQKLPLFPLNTVLFPGAHLALQIFEDRYRTMIGRCLEQGSPFGVVLIHEGEEVGAPVGTTYTCGTTAAIEKSEKLEDGRYYLVTVGQRRFRVQYVIQRVPYIIASVALLPEESSNAVADQAQQLKDIYKRYWQAISAATGASGSPDELSEDVVELTYQLAHRLHVSNQRKQRWLEADVSTRLREISAELRSGMVLLPRTSPGKEPPEWEGSGSWN